MLVDEFIKVVQLWLDWWLVFCLRHVRMTLSSKMTVLQAVFVMVLLVACANGSAAPNQRSVFWVAPTMSDCGAKSPCYTLSGYQKDRPSVFSTSHATWIFLQGRHEMLPTPIVVTRAQNITWMSEPGCTARECQIIQPSYCGSTVNESNCSYVVFEGCQGVSVSALGFMSPDDTGQYPGRCHSVKLVGVEDVTLHSVKLIGRYGLGVFDASGRYKVANSYLETNVHNIALNVCPSLRKNCTFSLSLTNLTLSNSRGIYFNVSESANTEYSSISILVDDCSIAAGFGQKILVFNVWGYPSDSFAVTVRNSVFQNNVFSMVLRMVLMVQNWSLVGAPQYRPRIHLDGVSISNSFHCVKIDLSYKFHDNSSCDAQLPEIIITNSVFFDSMNHREDEIIHMFHATLRPNNSIAFYDRCRALHSQPFPYSSPILRFRGAKFYSNKIPVVVYLEGFYWHRATFDGGNEISNNNGIGLVLNDTQLEIHGCNDIHNNSGGVLMTSDSLLLMANGSELTVMDNVADDFGGGVHISYKGRSAPSFEEFLKCYVNKTTCPGWCFFQFVDQNGDLLMQEEVGAFHATMKLLDNAALIDGHEIFNGHLDNCSLMTKNGTEYASTDTLLTVLPPSALEDNALGAVPYDLCLCDIDNPHNNSLRDCRQNITRAIYPGEEYPLLVTVLKDLHRPSFQTVIVKDNEKTSEEVTTGTCYKVYTVEYQHLGQHSLQLETYAPGPDSDYGITTLIVFNHLDCPLGMQSINTTCTCNSVLADHGFSCSVHWFKSTRRYNWIGMENGRLIFGDRCIFDLCDPSALANGIPPSKISSSSQCSAEFGREGLMCTQCPRNQQPEYFSFNCRECPYEWIALLLLLFVGGVFVVVVLFVFNLTHLQGTINGLILYCNMIVHTWSAAFFSRYAWKPLYIVIRVLSLGLGHGLCFFDEFSKGLLHFVFPFYLLALVVTIIICAHKCNLRIFRVTFIARRAVPVLTTLMIMTFISLSDAVLLALQHNHIYDAITEKKEVVFLFDSTLSYFRGKHLVLGVLSILCCIVYLFPLVGVTLLGDLLRRCVRSIWLSHFIDVFHGCYRYPFGFWLGVRLLARIVVMVVALSVQTQLGKALSMFVVILCLCLFQLCFKPFRTLEDHLATSQYSPSSCRLFSGHSRMEAVLLKLQPSTLEFLYMVNSLITSAAIMYGGVDHDNVNVTLLKIAANASLLAAILQFIAILCYHTYRFFPLPKPARMCLKNSSKRFSKRWRGRRQTSTECDVTPTFDDTAAHAEPVMHIRLQPYGNHDDNHDSDESMTDSDRDDETSMEQSVTMTDVTDSSPGLTERLLLK